MDVEPAPLPVIRQSSSFSRAHMAVHEASSVVPDESGKIFDVFISHASEDKDAVARPLAQALSEAGLSVWYDEFEMRVGDSLRRKIDQELAYSRFGIFVISRDFIKKGWTNCEFDGIIIRNVAGEQTLLPIWHNIIRYEVVASSPTLADKFALNTAAQSIVDIASDIAELIKSRS